MVRNFSSDLKIKVDSDFIGIIKRTVDFSNKKTNATKQNIHDFFASTIDIFDKNVKGIYINPLYSRTAMEIFLTDKTIFLSKALCTFTQSNIRKQLNSSQH